MAELNLILLGPPGSGKGTQGERLQEDLEYPYYATGDILRAAVKEGTEVGKSAKEYMDRGDLVPDEVIIGIIAERLESGEADHGFIVVLSPKAGRVGHVDASDIEEAATTAGLHTSGTVNACDDWTATKLVAPKSARR